MTEEEQPTPDTEEQSFAEMLEAFDAAPSEALQVGDQVQGRIIAIDDNNVFFDIGTKIDGVADKEDLRGEKGAFDYQTGDELTLYVVAAEESEVRLSRALSGIGGLNMLKDAYTGKLPVEGKVQKTIKGGFEVEIMKRRAFCPISQIDTVYVEEPDAYVGQTYTFQIRQFEQQGRKLNLVVSRRTLLEKEQQAAKAAFFKELETDQVLEGRVARLAPYGAFVELIPGLEGMVHISELGWSRVEKPEESVTVGDRVQVKVLSIAEGKKAGEKKIGLSIKQVQQDPWLTVTDQFKEGAKVAGKVMRCANFGVFVAIAPGIEGLVHISEMSYTKRVTHPEAEVSPGQDVFVMVKSIDAQRRRIALSLRDAEGDPWADIVQKYPVGKTVSGTVEKKEGFGLFINLEPGITGLLPKSKISASSQAASIAKLKPGHSLNITIDRVDAQARKISLGLGEDKENANWRQFSETSSGSLGDLGDKLKQALEDKKSK
jgi:small subunit ribosomal protein S1